MATAQSQLTDWFTYLNQFKACCNKIETDTDALNLLQFCNAKITDLLDAPPSNEQAAFSLCASAATGLPVTPAAVSGASSFLTLLDSTWAFPDLYVAAYMRSLSPAPFSTTMKVGDFILQKTGVVFPAGAKDANWVKIDPGLATILGADLYSATQRAKVAAIVTDPTKIVSDVVDQIVVFG
jgi:hypothetical protein